MINLILSHWVTNLLVVWLIVIVAGNLWVKWARRRRLVNRPGTMAQWSPRPLRAQSIDEVDHSQLAAH